VLDSDSIYIHSLESYSLQLGRQCWWWCNSIFSCSTKERNMHT